MSLVSLLVFIILVTFAFWVLGQMGLDPKAMQIARIVLAVIVLLYLVQAFGLFEGPVWRYR